MKDGWMNMGFETTPLKPYIEPLPNYYDIVRLDVMASMGFSQVDIENSLSNGNFDNITATYFLLEGKGW